jgi:hypothetical protein
MDGTDVTPDGVIPVHGSVVGAQALPVASPMPSAVPGSPLTVSLFHFAGMEGMTLSGEIRPRGGAREDLFQVMIDARDFSATEEISLSPGVYILEMIAVGQDRPQRMCEMEFNLRHGDELSIFISGIPEAEGGLSGCPIVTLVLGPVNALVGGA